MHLKSIKYQEFSNTPKKWELECFDLNKINLLVGRNASGKTRTLNIIWNLANLLSGNIKNLLNGKFEVIFDDKGKKVVYKLSFNDAKVSKESLSIDGDILLNRTKSGKGTIKFYEIGNKAHDFQISQNEIEAFTKRDAIQHPFLSTLYQWAKSVRHYSFGSSLGRDSLIFRQQENQFTDLNPKDSSTVGLIFLDGITKYKRKFSNAIKKEMAALGYEIENIGIGPIPGVKLLGASVNIELEGIYVTEGGLDTIIHQNSISQGMFRALSLIIQINYSFLEGKPDCIIIDDIGEGLDNERSKNLIELLIKKANKSKTQLIISTNDQFVMNSVPLDYWAIINRKEHKVKIINKSNSEKIFTEFKFTGLNNFDFFKSDFYLNGFEKTN